MEELIRSMLGEKAIDVGGSADAAWTHGGGAGEGGGIVASGGKRGADGGGTSGDGGRGGAMPCRASGGGEALPSSMGAAVSDVTASAPEAHDGAPSSS